MRRAALCALIALAVAGCTHPSAPGPRITPSSAGPGVEPVRAGSIVACPANATVLAAGRWFYPPWFPLAEGLPPDAERCFATVRQAVGAGYHLAPLPAGGLRIGGIYLVPAPSSLAASCRRAAAALRFPVACPALLPGPANAAETFPLLNRRMGFSEFLVDERFPGPPAYRGASAGRADPVRPSTGHLDVQSDPMAPARGYCTGASVVGSMSVRGTTGQLLECPEGSEQMSGHIVLAWHEAGSFYAVSFHGHSAPNRRFDRVLAEHLQLVFPNGSRAAGGAGGG